MTQKQRPYTYKNQRLICIKKPNYAKIYAPFLQIGSDDWHRASQELSKSAFILYLYLMENGNDFEWALSPVAIENALGMKERTYHSAKTELIEKGYMIEDDSCEKNCRYAYCLANPELDVGWCDKTWEDNFIA